MSKTMDKQEEMPTVQEISNRMQFFGVFDYVIFVAMLLSCCCVGLFHAFRKKSVGENEYLVGGRNMNIFPISMSLIASFISGISLLGIPTEIYVHGTSYLFIDLSLLISGIIMSVMFLPIFHEMQLTSIYEYLERRFDKKIRIFGSILFIINIVRFSEHLFLMLWLPIVIYMPALAFNQAVGINIHIVTPFICLVCIFYTCVGGLKAVVWTDFIQAFVMFATMIFICIKGTVDLGGLSVLINRNLESGRLEGPSTSFNPLVRHTVLSVVIGSVFHNLQGKALNQNMIQRYLALPSIKAARKALWLFTIGIFIIDLTCGYTGLLIYAWYHDCDPLTTKLAKQKDQLLPLLVMEVLGKIPGLPGLFISAVFSAALSSLSTGLNSMTAVVFEDFIKPFQKKPLNGKNAERIMKLTVVILGILCTALVFVVEKASTHVLQLSKTLSSITSGSSLAIYFMGVLVPWINAKGALIGGVSGVSFMAWFCISAQLAINNGLTTSEPKPVNIDNCTYTFDQSFLSLEPENTETDLNSQSWTILRLSYLLYTVAGFLLIMSTSLIATIFTSSDLNKIDPILVAPFIRKYLKPNKEKPKNLKSEENQCVNAVLNKENKIHKTTKI